MLPWGVWPKPWFSSAAPDHPTTVALQAAAESGSERDIKNARTLFMRLKPGDRRAALAMLAD